ncbi:integrase core domain-containing protein, partial [Xanthomonas campestris pv. campestris]|uniref:integrase core domain-containing protein n=1 Tax=Xanthomonas campestris TaxID=339 RepID=UPI0032E4D823
GKPQQNAYVERYNRTVRYAFLARTLFDTIEQVQDKATRWLWGSADIRVKIAHKIGFHPLHQ